MAQVQVFDEASGRWLRVSRADLSQEMAEKELRNHFARDHPNRRFRVSDD